MQNGQKFEYKFWSHTDASLERVASNAEAWIDDMTIQKAPDGWELFQLDSSAISVSDASGTQTVAVPCYGMTVILRRLTDSPHFAL